MTEQASPPSKTRILIVGSGIVGSSLAYHLAHMGQSDVVVLDKGDLQCNDGSTSHAPGGMHVTSPSKMMTDFAVTSTEVYSRVAPFHPDKPCFRPVGGIELAQTPARLVELKRRHGIATAFGVRSELLSPEQCTEKVPLLDPNSVLGGFWVPRDTNVGGSDLTSAMARDASEKGVQFFADTEVKELLLDNNRVVGVKTPKSEITAEQVVICTNIWAPLLAKQVGLELPLMAAQHQYAVTSPLPELAEYQGQEIVLPTMRAQDHALYFRQHGDCWGIGNYRHEPLLVAPKDVGRTAMRDFTPHHFEQAWSASCELFPALKGAELVRSFNGMFAFTIDGAPIMGPTRVSGLWVGVGIWITHAGGVGRALAEWLTRGAPSTDCSQADVNRFHAHQTAPDYVFQRCFTNYAEVYDIHHPAEPLSKPRGLRLTPVHQRMVELNAKLVPSGGWEVPKWYDSNSNLLEEFSGQIPSRDEWAARHWSPIQGAEHLAVRARAGLFNLGALGVIEVTGPGAQPYLEHLCTNAMAQTAGRLTYTLMLDQGGGIRADLTVARWEDSFWVMNGGAILPLELAWLRRHLPQDGSVELVDRSSGLTTLGLWGPRARDILSAICPDDLSNSAFPFYHCLEIKVVGLPVRALRLSYAGELGWELYCPTEFGSGLWDALWRAGAEHGLVAAGSGAFDSLRLEKAYRLYGQDMTAEHTPQECGLNFVVADKPFLGKEALLSRVSATRLECLALKGGGALLGGEPVYAEDQPVGFVTSANYGYSVGRFLALARVDAGADMSGRLQVEYLGQRQDCEVVKAPLFDPNMTRMRG